MEKKKNLAVRKAQEKEIRRQAEESAQMREFMMRGIESNIEKVLERIMNEHGMSREQAKMFFKARAESK